MIRFLKRGFSLSELLIAVSLATLILLIGLTNTRSSTEAAETRGLADQIAEELRSARRRAIAQGTPVAVGFPTGNGTAAHCQGIYLMEGRGVARVVRGRRYDGDFPNACAFVGLWPLEHGAFSRSMLDYQGNSLDFDMERWEIPNDKDYLFVFTPSGHLVTNGVPHFEGRYHILISEGITATPSGPPLGSSPFPISYFQATEVSKPVTISLSPAGEVSVSPGLAGSLLSGSGRISSPAAPLLPNLRGGNRAPRLLRVTADPLPPELPPGVEAIVPKNGYLTLRIEVTEPDGQVPACRWLASGGTLSSATSNSMAWNPKNQTWTGSWVWYPPQGATDGQEFTLSYRVEDGFGGLLSGRLGATGRVKVGRSQRIFFGSSNGVSLEIAMMTPDGLNRRFLTSEWDDEEAAFPSVQPGGNQVSYLSHDNVTGVTSVSVINADGSNPRRLHSVSDPSTEAFVTGHLDYSLKSQGAAWSSDGTRLAYVLLTGAECSLFVCNADGSGRQRLTSPGPDAVDTQPSWSPDGQWILFRRDNFDATGTVERMRVARIPASGGPIDFLAGGGSDHCYDPSYSPDGSQIVFVKNSFELRLMDADGANKRTIAGTPFPINPRISPDGALVAVGTFFGVNQELRVCTIDGLHPDTSAPGLKDLGPDTLDTFCVTEYAWSPDSRSLLYARELQLWEVPVHGPTTAQQRTKEVTPKAYSNPWWLP